MDKSLNFSKKHLHCGFQYAIIQDVERNYILPFYPIHSKTEKALTGSAFFAYIFLFCGTIVKKGR